MTEPYSTKGKSSIGQFLPFPLDLWWQPSTLCYLQGCSINLVQMMSWFFLCFNHQAVLRIYWPLYYLLSFLYSLQSKTEIHHRTTCRVILVGIWQASIDTELTHLSSYQNKWPLHHLMRGVDCGSKKGLFSLTTRRSYYELTPRVTFYLEHCVLICKITLCTVQEPLTS